MNNNSYEQYTKTYTSFSGCDIVCSFNGIVCGELQAISYSISREKSPCYTMGSAEPRSFSRGKRGCAGTMVFTVFNRDVLIESFKDKMKTTGVTKFKAERSDKTYLSIDEWDNAMTDYANVTTPGNNVGNTATLVDSYQAMYADEIPPFDVTINFANEYGQRAVLTIYGCEILNEGSGFSIDSITSEKAYTFVARKVDYMKSLDDNDGGFSSTY